MRKEMTLDDFISLAKSQGVPREKVTFQCPICKTLQSADDLVAAGAGQNFEDVEKYLAFSCVGRFDGTKGCDWSLGGLFKLHKLEVVTPDGEHHPRFMPVAREEGAA